MDGIEITGIRCYGYTGLLPEERVLGQWFEVDLKMSLDLAASGQSDKIEDTLDYRGTIGLVRHLVQKSRFSLLEALAEAIAAAILASDPVAEVQVRLSKLAAPIPDFSGKITVEILRRRDGWQAQDDVG
ncbi:MAG TPA: dihydroneopterin aldolase [Oscillatoriaceae cyanobacterium M33_DOE_052]|uniref:7,8-dihydroneopterin aldolase n=1 Tax=Planktothricoides sp. SpSt-374 TaxID=2282167 RepID=A0A7C3VLU5_9CYAN|nr:dihydroneopterin aldolase [Oscillatoriaceae cyanobacterium M33_DOE_052]